MSERESMLAYQLIRRRYLLAFLAVVGSLAAWVPSVQLRFDQSIESLYARENPHLAAYRRSKAAFGSNEVGIVAYTDPELFTTRGQNRQRSLTDRLVQVPGVDAESVQSLSSALGQARVFRLLSIKEEQIRELFRGLLLGDDDRTTAVMFRLLPATPEHPRAATIAELRRVAGEFAEESGLRAYVVGEPIHVHEMFRYVEEDGLWLWIYSSALLMAVLLLLLRSLRWTILPALVVGAAVTWTRALLVLAGTRLSMVSSMLNSLVTIIGVATVMHVAIVFRHHRRSSDRRGALRRALADLAMPVFWTCATTAMGFLVLLSSSISPVRSFGVMMGLGSMLVLAAVAAILPTGALLGRIGVDVGRAPGERWIQARLAWIVASIEKHPAAVSMAAVVLLAAPIGGFFLLRVETDFSKNFRASSPLVQGLQFVESKLGGAGTWEVGFSCAPELDDGVLEKLRALADELRALETPNGERLTKVIAITDGLDLFPTVPVVMPNLAAKLRALGGLQPEFVHGLYSPEAKRMRILLRARERQPSDAKLELIRRVEAAARKHFPDAETTGLFVMLTYLIESLMTDQYVSFALAGAGIVLLMSIAFRSIGLGLASLVPNVFPIVMVIGTMGWLGLPINIATAMISCVSMGLTVDSSIHYLSSYRRARRRGASFYEALLETHRHVGIALVLANLALVAGFLVLTASHFIPLVYFGALVSLAMLGGLVGNLFLLPLLLRLGQRSEAQLPAVAVASAGAPPVPEDAPAGPSRPEAD